MAHEQTRPSAGEHTAGTDTPIYDDLVRTVAGFTAPPARGATYGPRCFGPADVRTGLIAHGVHNG